MKGRKLAVLIVLLILVAGAAIMYFMYNKPHRSAASEKGLVVTATQLCNDYETDEPAADKKYIGQLLEISGTITDVGANQENNTVIMLAGSSMGGVQCTFIKSEPGLTKGSTRVIKGFCNGYLIPDVKLDRCVIKR